MGRSIPSSIRLQDFTRVFSSSPDKLHRQPSKQARPPITRNKVGAPRKSRLSDPAQHNQILEPLVKKKSGMEEDGTGGPVISSEAEGLSLVKLSHVVSDCVRRWFLDTLREAKAGDNAMQVLVGQMYNSGYGVTKDTRKGRAWINKASKNRSTVWKVGEKQPGYNASDSDSDVKRTEN